MNPDGTPKTLLGAVRNGMCMSFGPQADYKLKEHIRDFLAQKFTVAFFEGKDEAERLRLAKLWTDITGEDMPK